MRKIFYTLLLTTGIFFTSCDKKDTNANVTLKGTIKGFKQGKLYLVQVKDTTLVAVDSLIVDGNSDFLFRTNLDSPEVFYLALDRGHTNSPDNQIPIFLEPGEIQLNTTLKKFFADAKISGSNTQEVYENYLKTRTAINERQNDLIVDIFEAEKSNNISKRDSLVRVSERLIVRKYLNAVNFALNHKNSEVAPYIALSDLYDANTKFLDTIYNALDQKVAKSKYGIQLAEFIQERKQLDKQITSSDN
ncbi:DUF4369 domain-containing protein [Myroides sp. LJL119]